MSAFGCFALASAAVFASGAVDLLPAQERADSLTADSGRVVLPTVVVIGARGRLGGAAAPLPGAELSGEVLRRETSVSLARAIERLPGLRTLSTGEQVGKPVIRGLSGPRVLVLDNGLRLEEQSWSDEDGPSADSRLADRIEVIRGPASVLYGSDAIGGVVNLLPAPVPRSETGAPSGAVHAELYGASNNTEAGVVAGGEGARGRMGGRLTLVGRHAADLHTPAGELPNTGFSALDGEVAVAVHGGSGQTTLRYTRTGGEFKLLEAGGAGAVEEPSADTGEGGPERKLSDDRVQVASTYLVGGLPIEGKAQWQRHWIAEESDEAPAQGGGVEAGRTFELALNTWTTDLLVHHALGSRVSGTAGVSGMYQTNDTRGPVLVVPDATVRGVGLYALERLSLGRWSLLAGVRGDLRGIRPAGDERAALRASARDFASVTADLGAVVRPGPAVSLSLNLGRAWRAPNLLELYANGPRLGEARYDVGDPRLDPETSFNLDLGGRWTMGPLHAEVSAYRNRIAGYIFGAPTAEFADSLRVYRYGQTDAVLTGFEAEIGADVLSRLSLGGAVSYTRGSDDESGAPLPLMPPLRGRLEAELRGLDFGWLDQGRIGAELELVGRQGRLGAYSVPGSGIVVVDQATGGYALVRLELSGERWLAGRRISLALSARNLLGTEYRDYLSRYKEFAPNPGRNISLRVEFAQR